MKTYADFNIEIPHNGSGEVYTQCPQCSHERKKKRAQCLGVNLDEGVWVCHHCGWAGTLKGKTEHRPPHWDKPVYRKPRRVPKPDLPPKVIEWFSERGITSEVLIRNKIGYDTVYMPQLESETSAIAFPYYRGGEHINTKWRDGRKNFRLEASAELLLYGLDDIADGPIIWVEGEMDKLSLEVAGFPNCVSVPNGAPPATVSDYAGKLDWLDVEQFEGRKHILFFDMDEPGRRLEHEIARRLGKENCSRVIPPMGCKDANEVLTKHDAKTLADAASNAQDFPVDGIKSGETIRNGVLTFHTKGRERGVSTGWPDVDEIYSVRPGEMTIVTGIPNSGKSNWLDCLLVNIAKEHGWRFGVFSPENLPLEEHAAGLCEKYSKVPFDPGPTPRMSSEDVAACMDWLQNRFWWVLPDDTWTLDNILESARYLVKKHGITGFVIDPWNEIEHKRPPQLSETEYISESLGRIRRFARENSIHIWIVAHPTKLRKNDAGQYDVPTPYDISGSAHWRNKADNCISVYRHFQFKDDTPKPVEIHVQKIRFKHIGHIGKAELDYEYATGTYRNHAPRHYAA